MFSDRLKQKGVQFYEQFILSGYILDFYLPEYKLGFELDGSGHYTPRGIRRDSKRDKRIKEAGVRIIRIPNDLAERIDLAQLDDVLLRPQSKEFHRGYMATLEK